MCLVTIGFDCWTYHCKGCSVYFKAKFAINEDPGIMIFIVQCRYLGYCVGSLYDNPWIYFKNLKFILNVMTFIHCTVKSRWHRIRNLLLYSLLPGIDQKTEGVVMMTKEGSTKIVTFMTPGVGILVPRHGNISHVVKMHYFFKNILLYTKAYIRQTE